MRKYTGTKPGKGGTKNGPARWTPPAEAPAVFIPWTGEHGGPRAAGAGPVLCHPPPGYQRDRPPAAGPVRVLDRVLSAPEQELEKVEGVGQGAAVLLRLMGSIGDPRRPGREEKIVASVSQAGPTSCGCWTGSGRSGCISCAWTPRERCCPAGCCPRGRRT